MRVSVRQASRVTRWRWNCTVKAALYSAQALPTAPVGLLRRLRLRRVSLPALRVHQAWSADDLRSAAQRKDAAGAPQFASTAKQQLTLASLDLLQYRPPQTRSPILSVTTSHTMLRAARRARQRWQRCAARAARAYQATCPKPSSSSAPCAAALVLAPFLPPVTSRPRCRDDKRELQHHPYYPRRVNLRSARKSSRTTLIRRRSALQPRCYGRNSCSSRLRANARAALDVKSTRRLPLQ